MEVLLTRDVQGLGKAGEKVTAKDGYARNFLLPRGLAVAATRGAGAAGRAIYNAQIRSAALAKGKAAEIARRLCEVSCELTVRFGDQGKMHGAVTAADILQALAKKGISLQKHQLELEKPLAHLGEHPVSVRLHPEVRAIVNVILRKA